MKDYPRYYKELNERQRRAVDGTEGQFLILAGPGTGKTQLLSVRAASIIESGRARPENILILTYTNTAAKAMKERLASVIGLEGYDVEVGTFHSFANTLIQDSEEAAEYIGEKVELDDIERVKSMEQILDSTDGVDDIRPFKAPYLYLKEILRRIGELKKDAITPGRLDSYLKDDKSHYRLMDEKYVKRLKALSAVYRRYEAVKNGSDKDIFDERGRYDFEDMIIFATEALKKEAGVRDKYRQLYKYVMVDEFQDTNGSQMELLFALIDPDKANLLCVGDDDQSIYRFQGANIGNFRALKERFPELKTLSLKENYRSPKELIDLSGRIISMIPQAKRAGIKELESVRPADGAEIIFKEFTAEEEELLYIVDKVGKIKASIEKDRAAPAGERSDPYSSIAILVRKRAEILKLIDAFLQAGIPYATDGKEEISGEYRVRQLLDALELACIDPGEHALKDMALYKVLSADYMGIPQSDILAFIAHVNRLPSAKNGARPTVLGELLSFCVSGSCDARFIKPECFKRGAAIIGSLLKDSHTRPVHSILIEFIKDAGVFNFILKEYSDNGMLKVRQLRSVASFVNMVKSGDIANPGMRLADFMEEIKTRKTHGIPVQGELVTLSQPGVRIYTAHGAKGMEFNYVMIPFCLNNKNWPARQLSERIKLPADLFKTAAGADSAHSDRDLNFHDETRLFYVAATRARKGLIFTASPADDAVPSIYLEQLGVRKDDEAPEPEEKVLARSVELTDAGDPFIGTDRVLRDMTANLTLNPTRLNTYISCKRRFLFNDMLKLPGPKKRSLVFGNCVHKALEEVFRRYMSSKKFPTFTFFMKEFKKELAFQGVDDTTAADCLKKAETVRGWFLHSAGSPVMPLGLERKLMVTVGDNIIFTGKYDKVEFEDESRGVIRILDYKTGKPDDHLKAIDGRSDLSSADCDGYLRQLACYRLLFERDTKESRGLRVGSGALVFIEPVSADLRRQGYVKGQYVTKSVEITDSMVAEAEELIKKVWSGIRSLDFAKLPERDDKICARCDFESICWGPR